MTASRALPPLSHLRQGDDLPAHTVTARNGSLHSDNKIHDDEVARKYGFAGGLVPGVTVYAYMAGPLAAALGERWLTEGSATVSLVQPLYEGGRAISRATVIEAAAERIDLDIRTENELGQRCGTGTASVPVGRASAALDIPAFVRAAAPPAPDPRPELFLQTAPIGQVLSPLVTPTSIDGARAYALSVFDTNPLFSDGSTWGPPLIHPGSLLSDCNMIFVRNFVFGPWIHTRSEIRYLGPALAGRTLTLHGRLAEAYERRMHHYAVLDLFCTDETGQPVARVRHTAIFKVHPKN
jgi:acyl dehydratase